ncbi:MAG: B12-binding domain-containing radical SAM protein [Spirochaetaceae bacterium]|jgi:radical SAM superfamily enzyme YgiQ (UPF0313 family)|nr:B12-binding domain-containing radical SAM protein [Spirochaetaceae bacterium]
MKKILLCSINARYSQTNLAIRYLASYITKNVPAAAVCIREWTIQQQLLDIIRDIAEEEPELVLFSVYIWNRELSFKAMGELKKLFSDMPVGAGGPEVSWQAERIFRETPVPDFIIQGEGEKTAAELAAAITGGKKRSLSLPAIPGIWYRSADKPETALFSGERELIGNLDSIPFPYALAGNLPEDAANRILYYESARGCPFRCAYCLSSLDKSVRYFSLERVIGDIDFFLEKRLPLIKFVDRTFNLDTERYCAIWEHIIRNHNGVTTFHFEIAAEYLSDAAFALLERAPEGAIQFEIGIQSVNGETLRRVRRSADTEKAADKIRRIPPQIHTHLDLIAGLPGETLADIRRSFDYTIALRPQMLQLGFLKILSGTEMEEIAEKEAIVFTESPPYQVLQTRQLPWRDIQTLRDIEHLLDIYYNSGRFPSVCILIAETPAELPPHTGSAFDFFRLLAEKLSGEGILYLPRKQTGYFSSLAELFAGKHHLMERLRFDYLSAEKPGAFPGWFERRYHKTAHEQALRVHTNIQSSRERYARSEYEVFAIHPLTGEERETEILFLYESVKTRFVILNSTG